jgi:hypothetical protein
VSWENASATVPVAQQYACGGSATSSGTAYGNEVVCFMLNPVAAASQQRLVVAPVMTNLAATGGNAACPSCTDYAKDPKGNIDPTGQYFFWVSNMGGARMDAFMVKIPSQVLTAAANSGSGTTGGGDTTPPTVSITAPIAGSTLSGTVAVSVNASDNIGVTSVQFLLDGADLGSEVTTAPYSVGWDTSTAKAGVHILSAIAKDAAGNSATATTVSITTFLDNLPPAITAVAADITGSSTATVSWDTSQQANSQVTYGTTVSYGASTTLSTSMVTAHSSPLTGLAAGTTYHYQVISSNSSGIKATSADQTFTTSASTTSTTLPAASAEWQFSAGRGSSAVDSSGHGHTGALTDAPPWVAGISGDALAFNGSNQSVTVNSVAGLNGYPLTVSTWFKTTSASGTHGLINKYAANSHNGYQLFMSSGKLCAWFFRDGSDYVWDGSSCSLPASGYNDGQWHMAAFTVDGTGGKLYVDGTLKASRAWNGRAGAGSSPATVSFAMEPGVSASHFQGSLDEISIYGGKSLSAAQIATLYASFPVVTPVAWTSLANLTATGGSLQKTGGCDGCEDATALSQQQLAAGASSYLEFTATETNTLRTAGLTQVGSAPGYANMGFAIRLQSGSAEVREKGVYKADTSFVSGDVFRIAVGAGIVNYYKNGAVFYTSTTPPIYPLQGSASINSLGGTITNAVIKTH